MFSNNTALRGKYVRNNRLDIIETDLIKSTMYFCDASFQGHFRTTEDLGSNDAHHQTTLRVYFSYRSKTLDIYLMVMCNIRIPSVGKSP